MWNGVEAVRGDEAALQVVILGLDGSVPKGVSKKISEAISGADAKPGKPDEAIVGSERIVWVRPSEEGGVFFAVGQVLRRALGTSQPPLVLWADADAYAAAGEAVECFAWSLTEFKGTGSRNGEKAALEVRIPKNKGVEAFQEGQKLGRAVNWARQLGMTPPNVATTCFMVDQAKSLEEAGLTVEVFDVDKLEELGMVGLLNVGKASENPPYLVRIEHSPEGTADHQPVVLVGKTICYDTGGLSLKPREGMVGMKHDKDGGCAVLGAMKGIAEAGLKTRVVAFLCIAENSVSDEAMRPDDVLRYANGVTVEVTNTDAEGRLVLADGLCYAIANESPAAVLDIATLTGGVVTALGKVYAGVFSNDESLFEKVMAASKNTNEKLWRLPLHPAYREMMVSPVADIVNSNANRQAHPVQGAAFLSYFVPDEMPWVHLDIAGTHSTDKDHGPFPKGPTGFGVRLFVDLVKNWQ